MKKLLLLSLILAITASLNAQTVDKKWGFGLGLGAYVPSNEQGIGLMSELYMSRFLSQRFDLMLKGDLGVLNSKQDGGIDLANAFLNLRLNLANEDKKFRPYLFAGPGFLADNSTSGLNFDAGIGAKYYRNPGRAFYLDLGYLSGIEADRGTEKVHDNIVKGTIGMEFNFGKAKDSDMDGVSDNKDKCPNTPAGVAVDKDGCPLDTDGDGVADYIDDCPTIAGLAALKGCPDADGDGVADKDDKCPDTPKGVKVDAFGCPLDTDKDGVQDGTDKCADTPAGVKVDKDGCPVDTDGDGTPDYLDKCPTVTGPKENKGCPVIEEAAVETVSPEMTIEPIYFDYDKSNILPVEKAKIEKLVKLLKSNDTYSVDLTGNADSKGEEEYNMKLSERRIDSVIKAITNSGVKAARIAKQKPLGETEPAATNDTEEGRALNRRVTIEVIKSK